jgi:hypothetical protein
MDRTLAMDGIPASRVGGAEELGFKPHPAGSVIHGSADQFPGCFPGGGARGAAYHPDVGDLAVFYINFIFRSAEQLTIFSQADLPGKATSGRRGQHPFAGYFFPRRDDRNFFLVAEGHQIVGEVLVFEKIKHQIGVDIIGQIAAGIIKDRWYGLIDGYDFQLYIISSITADSGDFFLAAAVLLEDHNFLGRMIAYLILHLYFLTVKYCIR